MTEFEEVYRLYFRDVYRYCLALCRDEETAEEVTQETFFKALNAIDQFDGRCRLYVWLCQIAKNTYLSMRSKKRPDGLEADIPSGESLEERLLTKESAFEIHRVLHRLEEPYKEVFMWRVFAQLSFKQIGSIFGKNENWACVTYHRARKMIIQRLEEIER